MEPRLSISGIYDQRTLNFLIENNISMVSFDLRPHSLNFIQEYRLIEIIKDRMGFTLLLQFENEKDFIIQKIIESCRDVFEGEIHLYFSGDESAEFCTSFGLPYFKRIHDEKVLPEWGQHFKGVVFPWHILDRLYQNQAVEKFMNQFYLHYGSKNMDIMQLIEGDWDSNFNPSLSELLDIDFIQISINHKVEVCFRNVDLQKLRGSLKVVPMAVI